MNLNHENGQYPGPDDLPIGDRELTMFEEGDMLVCGLSAEQIRDMTPRELASLAEMTVDQSNLHLGS